MIPDGEGLQPDEVVAAATAPTVEASTLRAQLAEALPPDQRDALLSEYDALPLPKVATPILISGASLTARLSADPALEAAWRRVRAGR